MPFLRFLMLLTLIVWLGAIIFFAFVLAPTVFSVLPTRHLAGAVVNRSLGSLHWIGIISGVVFLFSSMLYAHSRSGSANLFAARHILMCLMLALTLTSQLAISPKLAVLRSSMGDIESVSATDPARIQFNALHAWSTRLEGGVLFMGLVVVYLTASAL
jgi:hypothetical protein